MTYSSFEEAWKASLPGKATTLFVFVISIIALGYAMNFQGPIYLTVLVAASVFCASLLVVEAFKLASIRRAKNAAKDPSAN